MISMPEPWITCLIGGLGFGTNLVTWLVADGKSKARIGFLEEKVGGIKVQQDSVSNLLHERISGLEIRLARSEQDRTEIHRMVERLDISKASREVVEGNRSEIATLKVDIDKRFDRIERLIERTLGGRGDDARQGK